MNRMRLNSSNACALHVRLNAIKLFKSKNPELCMMPPCFGGANKMVGHVISLLFRYCCATVLVFLIVVFQDGEWRGFESSSSEGM